MSVVNIDMHDKRMIVTVKFMKDKDDDDDDDDSVLM
jgi:hypothetical protein